MNTLFTRLASTALLLVSLPLHAITISLNPATQTVTAGSSFDLSLMISGLGSGAAPSLSTFDVDVSFDQSILSFSTVAFGPFLGDPSLGESITSFGVSTPGIVNLFELSFLEGDSTTCIFCTPPFLDDLQPAGFTLATLSFSALSAGASPLGITLNALGDANGDPLTADSVVDGSINVNANSGSVPEPATWLLLGLGALTMNRFIRRLSRNVS
jgi:hypothetical protein